MSNEMVLVSREESDRIPRFVAIKLDKSLKEERGFDYGFSSESILVESRGRKAGVRASRYVGGSFCESLGCDVLYGRLSRVHAEAFVTELLDLEGITAEVVSSLV